MHISIRRLTLSFVGGLALLVVLSCSDTTQTKVPTVAEQVRRGPVKLTDLPIQRVQIQDTFWAPRIETNRTRTLAHVFSELEANGNIQNFDIAAGKVKEKHRGPYWADSDVYKWLQAASYHLALLPDPDLEAKVDDLVSRIAAAQQKDGYIHTYVQTVDPSMRWANTGFLHELFCHGSLMEAGVAHFQATGKRTLLDVAIRLADYIDSAFGPGKRQGTSGHEEIELALVDLYRLTGERRYLRLAEFFLDQRGQKPSVFQIEYERLSPAKTMDFLGRTIPVRGLHDRFYRANPNVFDTRYNQDHLPVREQSEAVGHAVRAMYLYSGMADVVYETGDAQLMAALLRLHDSVALRRMYVTGGIGPSEDNEGFDKDYDLPNESAYQETCATVGLALWNHRMLKLTGDGRYADLMELALYNSFLGGVSLQGNTFCYVNPMRAREDFQRSPWFTVPCCPTTIVRTFPRLGTYIYSRSDDGIWANLYIAGSATEKLGEGAEVRLRQETNYPWEGAVKIVVETNAPREFTLHLRIPGWAKSHKIRVNGEIVQPAVVQGYADIARTWANGDSVDLDLPLTIDRLQAHPNVPWNHGKVALRQGPLIYAVEQADQGADLDSLILPTEAALSGEFHADLLGGIRTITGQGIRRDMSRWEEHLYLPQDTAGQQQTQIVAVPYAFWGNRGPGKMTVWVDAAP